MNLNRKQLSFLITLFSMSIVVLLLYSIHLGKEGERDDYVVEMILDEADLEELLQEEEKQDPPPADVHQESWVCHRAGGRG